MLKRFCSLILLMLLMINMIIFTCASEGENIDIWAMGAKISFSSESRDDPALCAFDGNSISAWHPNEPDYNGDWLRMDFKEDVTVNCFTFYEGFDYSADEYNYAVKEFMVQYSDNGKEWRTAHFGEQIGLKKEVVISSVTTKHLRFVFRTKDGLGRATINEIKLSYNPALQGNEVIRLYPGEERAMVSGVEKMMPKTSVIDNGTLMVPARFLTEALGFSLEWQAESGAVVISRELVKKQAKIYYVAKNGDDAADGSKETPFATINKAAQIMEAGDTCLVREGIYRETVIPKNSGNEQNPITFEAYPGEKVTISGADEIESEWTQDKAGVYKATVKEPVKQLFVDGKMMNNARYPNVKVDKLFEASGVDYITDGTYTYVDHGSFANGDLNGAKICLWSGEGWTTTVKTVTQDRANKRLYFDEPFPDNSNSGFHEEDPYKPKAGNKFYMYGKRDLLDIATEWAQEQEELYLWVEGNDSPNKHLVETKKRDWAFDVLGKSNINIKGFDIIGAAIRLASCKDSVIDDCRILYQGMGTSDMFYDKDCVQSTLLQGEGNTIKNSLIAYSLLSGIRLFGQNNTVENCIIHDANSMGSNMGPIVYMNGLENQIIGNTLYNAGRDIVQFYSSKKFKISKNNMYQGGRLSKDLGAIYGWRVKADGAEISYNDIHDMNGFAGIYLDNFSSGFSIHHNLVHKNIGDAIILNSPSNNHNVYNNTLIDVVRGNGSYSYSGFVDSHQGVKWANNLVVAKEKSVFIMDAGKAPEFSNNLETDLSTINLTTFMPSSPSAFRDKGAEIAGVTNTYAGKAPDIGAFEFGEERWIAGANWEEETR